MKVLSAEAVDLKSLEDSSEKYLCQEPLLAEKNTRITTKSDYRPGDRFAWQKA